MIKNISVFGDSILKGVVFDETTRRYKVAKQNAVESFKNKFEVVVDNYSKFGCTAKKGFEILKSKLTKSENKENVVLIELGGNDSDYDWDAISNAPEAEHFPKTPLSVFRETLQDMVKNVKNNNTRLCIMNLPPIDSTKYFNWVTKGDKNRKNNISKFLGDKSFIYRHHELYSRAIEDIAKENSVYLINVRDTFLSIKTYADYLCEDGIHLNEKGQSILNDLFTKVYLEKAYI